LKRLCADAGVPYRGVHALRHYCATRLYALTHDIYKAQDHLRHSNIHTTTVYARNDHAATYQAVDSL
jgi:integrase/recombinase XerC